MAHTGQPRWSGAMDCAVSHAWEPTVSYNQWWQSLSRYLDISFYPTALYILHHMNVLYLNQSNMQLRFSLVNHLLLKNIFNQLYRVQKRMRQRGTAHYTLPPQIAESALPPARGLLTQKPGPAKLLGGDWVALHYRWLIRPGPGLIMLCCLGQGRWRCSLFRGGHFTSFKVWCPFLHVSILLPKHSLFILVSSWSQQHPYFPQCQFKPK